MYRINPVRRNVLRRRQAQQSSWFSVSSGKVEHIRPAAIETNVNAFFEQLKQRTTNVSPVKLNSKRV